MTSTEPPPLPAVRPRAIPPHKILLAVILAGSILFVCLILCAGGIAILREGSPRGHAGLSRLLHVFKHLLDYGLGSLVG